ncbi:MAG: nucleoside deaminase [Clostridia bacterium]
METNEKMMSLAIKEAIKAKQKDEVPIGAVIVRDGKVIARGYNERQTKHLATAHAEIIAINKACKKLGDYRLNGCSMYVTLEPCLMCAGACLNARLDKVYFGAYEVKVTKNTESATSLALRTNLNHNIEFEGGILEKECSELLSFYFRDKRNK